jgi:hypothetical protein
MIALEHWPPLFNYGFFKQAPSAPAFAARSAKGPVAKISQLLPCRPIGEDLHDRSTELRSQELTLSF